MAGVWPQESHAMEAQEAHRLIARAVGGDPDALTDLLTEFGPRLEAALHFGRRWRTVIDVADVMQVTYLEAFIRITRFDPNAGSFLRWLRTIAANNLRDAIRGLSGRNRPPPERRITMDANADSVVELFDLLNATTTTPSRVTGKNEIHLLIRAAVARLPADYRTVIQKYDLEGGSITEVAAALNRSKGAIHMLRARAHDQLRTMLGAESLFFESRA